MHQGLTNRMKDQAAPMLDKGKKLFVDVGCWGCHPIEGYTDLAKRGPALTTT